MQAWQAGFQEANPDATINYDPVGSGGGREQFIAGSVAFAGSDAALDDDEIASATERCGDVIEIPVYVSPIAVIYNLDGVDELNLSPETLAGIFNQEITTWDDAAIAEDNPDATLPSDAITPVNRSDESGTTSNFTAYLAAAAGDAWPHEPDGVWPVSGGEAANGTSGVVGAVKGGAGTIGYADASQAIDVGIANIKVGDEFVAPSPEGAAAIVDASPRVEGRGDYDFAIELDRSSTDSGVYPLVLVSYVLACTENDAAQVDLLKGFLGYVVSAEGQDAAASNAGSAPISDDLRSEAETAIAAITAAS
jgi:phosphate transport system substrate-binding protein